MCVVCASLRPWNDTCDYADLEAADAGSSSASSTGGGGSTTTLPWLTPDQVADKLLLDFWDADVPVGFDAQAGDTITVDTGALTEAARAVARIALDEWGLSTGLVFAEVAPGAGDAQIVFDDEQSGAYAWSRYSHSTSGEQHIVRSNINISKTWWGGDVSVGGYGYQTYLHEIGHALGLGHAGSYNASNDKDGDGNPDPISFEDDAEFANDSWQATVMSYFHQAENPNVDASFAYLLTPMLGDLAAVWRLYSPDGPLAMREGDTVYGRGSNAAGVLGTDAFGKRMTALTLHDTGGEDHIDLSHTSASHKLDLRPGTISDAFGRKGTLVFSEATVIEHASTGGGQDHLVGNHLANRLSGGGGNDTIEGREGDDTLEGGEGSDRIHGGAYGEAMESGDDRISGGGGGDVVHGGDGDDHIDGGEHGDTLHGEDGEDTLIGGGGNDTMHGGAGRDAMTGDAGDDTMHGGEGDDTLQGGEGWDQLHGDAGRDILNGGDDDDTLHGGDGDDILESGSDGGTRWVNGHEFPHGNDSLAGGDGDDLFLLSGSWGYDTIEDLAFGDRVEATFDQGMSYEGFDHLFGGSVLRFAGAAAETAITLTGYLVKASEIMIEGFLLTILARDPSEPLPEPEPMPEPQPEPEPRPQPQPQPQPQPEPQPAPEPAPKPVVKPAPKPAPVVEPKPKPAPEPAPEPVPVVKPKPEPTPVVVPKPAPEPEPPVADPKPTTDPVSPPKDDEVPGTTSPEKDRDGSGPGSSDEILGGRRADRLEGDDGADTIRGRGGDDRLWGRDGPDRLEGDGGKDRLYGGDGDDRLYGGSGRDRLYGGEDDDRLYGGSGHDILKGQGGRDVLKGGAGDDVLDGSRGRDKLHGGSGRDELVGGSGDDTLEGGRDADALEGGSGEDELLGGGGRDRLYGGSGRDTLRGQEGNDRLEGNDGDDRLWGGAGRDTLAGGRGDDRLKGGGGDDVLAGQGGRDTLVGGGGADRFVFHSAFGRDRIEDFDPDADVVDLRGVRGLDGFGDVLAAARSRGDDLRLRLGDHLLILEDTALRELDADHFLL